MKDFRGLLVWRKSHVLTLNCYRISSTFPKYKLYGLISQMRPCAASIAANITEGCGKRGNGEFQRYPGIVAGSASELEYHLLLARDLGFLAAEQYDALNFAATKVKTNVGRTHSKGRNERLAG